MACPRCGEICHCYAGVRFPKGAQPRPRFEVDSDDAPSAVLVDPEQYDASEEQFSASLETAAAPAARFIPDESAVKEQVDHSLVSEDRFSDAADAVKASAPSGAVTRSGNTENSRSDGRSGRPSDAQAESVLIPDANDKTAATSEVSSDADSVLTNPASTPDAWKEELAARLSSYRAKRKPKPPKYPSLALDFEPAFPPTSGSGGRTSKLQTSTAIEEQQITVPAPAHKVRVVPAEEVMPPPASPAASGRLIEFPRFFAPEESSPEQLAEPVCEQPRILEAPDVELPAPALGGIVLENDNQPETEERPGFEVPLRSASISRRLFAAAIDIIVIVSAAVMFAYIFLQLVKVLPPLPHLLTSATLVLGVLWAGYQYLLLTYSGTTPGLRLAKLQLLQFDGSPVLRSRRRWRVLASLLSGLSLGLGFAWCFLDEDALCWHDRITRTHLVPRD